MAVSIDDLQANRVAEIEDDQDRAHSNRSTARAFAAAVSSLAISALVITTSADALEPDGTTAENFLQAGTISLTDDDGGRSLVDLQNMAPNRTNEECIEITYDGSIVPVNLSLTATAEGDLAPYVDMTIEQGTGGGFGDCEDFVPTAALFTGTLAELVAIEGQNLGRILNIGDEIGFRFRFTMADEQDALGRAARADFNWEVSPE